MKKKSPYLQNEIDIVFLIKQLWNNKIFIFITGIIFSLCFYFYALNKERFYYSNIKTKIPEIKSFYKYDFIFQKSRNQFSKKYENIYLLELNSLDNVVTFIENNSDFDEFKSYLKKNKKTVKTFFNQTHKGKKNFSIDRKGKKLNLFFPKELNGDKFLYSYKLFILKQAEKKFEKEMIRKLEYEINLANLSFKFAEENNIEEPIIIVHDSKIYSYNPFVGKIILEMRIKQLKKFLNDMNKQKISYFDDIFFDKATSPKLIIISNSKHSFLGFIVGLFFSSFIIFVRNLIKN